MTQPSDVTLIALLFGAHSTPYEGVAVSIRNSFKKMQGAPCAPTLLTKLQKDSSFSLYRR